MSLVGSWIRGQHWTQDRKPGYVATRSGRRFMVTHQTQTTFVTGQTSYVVTTPTFLIYQAAATRCCTLSSMTLCQVSTVAGAIIHIAIGVCSANKYSSGGTAVTPMNALVDPNDTKYSGDAGFTFRYNPTGAADGSDPDQVRLLYHFTLAPNSSAPIPFSFDTEDSVMIGRTGSILIYTWAGTTGPTWTFNFEVNEEDR